MDGQAGRPDGETLDLSAGQRGIWFACQADPASPAYNVACYLDLRGPLDRDAFLAAVRNAVAETACLRSRFTADDDGPRQTVASTMAFETVTRDFRSAAEPAAAAASWMAERRLRPYDLAHGPLFDFALLTLADDRHLWYVGYHQLVIDGAGTNLFFHRVAKHYAGDGQEGAQDDLTGFLAEEARYASTTEFAEARRYFAARFADRPAPLRVSGGASGAAPSAVKRRLELPGTEVDRLRVAAKRAGTRWFGLVVAVLAAYTGRLRGTDDVILSLALNGRTTPLAQAVPTRTANVLPLRLAVRDDSTWSSLGAQVTAEIETLRLHQRYRGEELRKSAFTPDGGTFFGPVVNFVPWDASFGFGAVTASLHQLETTPTEDLALCCYSRADGGLCVELSFHPGRYSVADVDAHTERFASMLAAVTDAGPDHLVGDVDVVSGRERDVVLNDWNDTAAPLPDASLPELFAARVAEHPDRIAVESDEVTLTYGELDRRVGRLAVRLAGAGVADGTPVGILMGRSTDLVVAILAVTRAGGAYVPLDGRSPLPRLHAMLDNISCSVLLVDGPGRDHALAGTGGLTVLDAHDEHPDREPPALPAGADRLAYIIHTSGSTGAPKGVEVTHRNVLALAYDRAWRTPAQQRILMHSPHAFDASTYEIWAPLLTGGRLVVAPGPINAPLLREYVGGGRVTAVFLTTALFNALAEGDPGCFSGPCEVWTGGEAVSPQAFQRVREASPGAELCHVYGPTETTTFATYFRIPPDFPVADGIPIGYPMDNTRAYVLDDRLRLVPPGVAGQLYLAGAGVARGYAGRPDLTAERFPADPFAGGPMYATGDLVRQRGDGALDYLGRIDNQVKIHGFRIEPSEIEVVLARHRAVSHVAVLVHEDEAGKTLVAHVAASQEPATEEDLRTHLRDRLPDYMIPSRFVLLDSLPLNRNGKVDRAALSAPPEDEETRDPRGPREEILCNLFAQLLDEPGVGVHDDFFELGGHSVLATKLVSRVRAELDLDIELRDLFAAPTVAELAERLDGAGAAGRPRLRPRDPGDNRLSHAQRGIWFAHQRDEQGPTYNVPMAVRLSGALDVAALRTALADVVARHESLRTVFPESRGVPEQKILDAAPVRFEVLDTDETGLAGALAGAARACFDLACDPPLRATLFRLGAEDHVLLLVVHHIAADAWSLHPLRRDLTAAYRARLAGRTPAWRALPVRYADYASWQHELLGAADDQESVVSRQTRFWTAQLAGLPEPALPTEFPRPAEAGHRGGTVPFTVDAGLHERLAEVAGATGTTLFMVVQAGLAALLTRLGAGTDIPVGCPVTGRPDPVLDDVVGCFGNSLVLRTDTAGDPGFTELLTRVRATDLAAFDHQDVPFEHLARNHAGPLYQVVLSVFRTPERMIELDGLRAARVPVDTGTARFDLSFICHERRGPDREPAGIDGVVEYASDLFTGDTAAVLAAALISVLRQACDRPDAPISLLDVAVPTLSARRETPTRVEPVTSTTTDRLAVLWSRILNTDVTSPDDSFFDLGGHSLQATALVAAVHDEFGVELRLREVFRHHLLGDLAAVIDSRRRALDLPAAGFQERIWLAERLEARQGLYNVPLAWRVHGRLDPERLARALARVVERHEILSTRFSEHEGELRQIVGPPWQPVVTTERLTGAASIGDRLREEGDAPFDLSAGPLLRAGLIETPDAQFLFLTVHHIIVDAPSIPLLLAELERHYAGDGVPEPARQFREVLAARSKVDDAKLERWVRYLHDAPSAQPFPAPASPGPAGVVPLALPDGLGPALRRLQDDRGVSWFMVAATAVAGMLHNLTGLDDVTFGFPSADRGGPEFAGVIGPCLNTLVLRSRCDAATTAGALLESIRDDVLDALEGQDVPFETIVRRLNPPRTPGMTPYVDVVIAPQLPVATPPVVGGAELEPVATSASSATLGKFALTISFTVSGDEVTGSLAYRGDRFDAGTAGQAARLVQSALDSLLHHPDQPVRSGGDSGRDHGLAELESALLADPDIAAAAAVSRSGQGVVGYVVPAAKSRDSAAVLARLRVRLPAKQCPDALVWLPELPRTSDGTVDSAALPAPADPVAVGRDATLVDGVERRLARIWSSVLPVSAMPSAWDNFFDLGGDSVRLVTMHAMLCTEFDVELPIQRLFENPTIRLLARYLSGERPSANGAVPGAVTAAQRATMARQGRARRREGR